MLEISVGCEKRAKAGSGRQRSGIVIARVLADQWQHFVCYVTIESRQQLCLQVRRHLLIEQAVLVDAIYGVSTNTPALDVWPYGIHQMKSFILEIVSRRGGKHQQWLACMAIGHQRHFGA